MSHISSTPQELRIDFESAQANAGTGHLRLLETNGPALVSATVNALRILGFDVVDADELAEHQSAKREDLRISCPGDESWIALAEVKGYSRRGAATNDLATLQRVAGRYEGKHGRSPDRLWYIVNAQFSTSPDERPSPLATSGEDVDDFASDGGLVLDTRVLFQLVREVEAGGKSNIDVRKRLMAASGVAQFS